LPAADGSTLIHGYAWGDQALHMALISWFREQPLPILELPLLPGAPLSYPFLVDWHSAVLMRLGASWELTLGLPTTLLLVAGGVLSVAAARRLSGSRRAAVFQLTLFLGLGSAAGIGLLRGGWEAFWSVDPSNLPNLQLALANPVTSHFFPQRSFGFGFALCMAVIVLSLEWIQQKRSVILSAAAVLLVLGPLVHVHSIVLAGAWLLGVAAIGKKWVDARSAVPLLVGAVLVLIQLWWLMHRMASSEIALDIGWEWNQRGSLLFFWLQQLGVTGLLAAVGLGAWRWWRSPLLTFGMASALMLVILGNVWRFQPNPFDNLKFMLYGFWFLLIPAGVVLDWLWRQKQYALTALFLVASTVVGALVIVRDLMPITGYTYQTKAERTAGEEIRKLLPLDAIVAADGRHQNIVPTLTGRRVVAGYDGWLWSYGLDYLAATEARSVTLKGGSPAAGATHVVVSDYDDAGGVADLDQLRDLYPEVYAAHGWHVFTIRSGSSLGEE
jgi:hypothetical protein